MSETVSLRQELRSRFSRGYFNFLRRLQSSLSFEHSSVIKLQTFLRMALQRKKFHRLKRASIAIQKNVRFWLGQRVIRNKRFEDFRRKNRAYFSFFATKIQKVFAQQLPRVVRPAVRPRLLLETRLPQENPPRK